MGHVKKNKRKRPPVKKRKRNPLIIAILGVVIAALGYFSKETIESLERTKSSLEGLLSSNKIASGQQITQMQIVALNQHIQLLGRQAQSSKKVEDRDFSTIISQDIADARLAQSTVRSHFEDVYELVNSLAYRPPAFEAELRETDKSIEDGNTQANKTLAISSEHDWRRMVGVKLAFIQILVRELAVVVVEDQAITVAQAQIKIMSFLVALGRWLVRALYLLGAVLTVYGITNGIKTAETSD